MWATKRKNTFPITSTYSSLLFLTSMLQQATLGANLLVSSGWFVGIRFQASIEAPHEVFGPCSKFQVDL